MEHGIDSIKLAVGIIIVCVVVALAFFVTRTGKNQVNQATAQLVDVTSQYDEPSKQVYDGIMVDGKEVIETINKFATDNTTAVKVYHKNGKVDVYNGNEAATAALTGTGTAGDPYLSDKYVAIGDPATLEQGATAKLSSVYDSKLARTDVKYINPGATYQGSILRNSDNVITCIVFTQQ